MKGQLPCGQSQNSSQSGKAQQSHSGADDSSDMDQMDGSPPPPGHLSQQSHGTPCSSIAGGGHQSSVNGPGGMDRCPSNGHRMTVVPPVSDIVNSVTQNINSPWPGGVSLPLATTVDTKPLMTSYEHHLGHISSRNQMELKPPPTSAVPGYEYAVRGYPGQLQHMYPPPNMCFNMSYS